MLATIAMFILISCGYERPEHPAGSGAVPLRITPMISDSGESEVGVITRAKIDGEFTIGSTIGLGVSAPDAVPAISSFYKSFYGLFGGDAWRYYLNNINGGDRLSGFRSWGNIEVYGYHPYNPATTNLGAVPFEIAVSNGMEALGTDATALTDHMVAGTQLKDMFTPDPEGDLPLHFKHMMTALAIAINRTGGTQQFPELKIGRVTFEITDGNREFVVSGTYNAIHPDMLAPADNITPGETVKKMTIEYLSSTLIEMIREEQGLIVPHRLLVIMPELRHKAGAEFEDATVKITFEFIDQDGNMIELDNGNPSVSFRLSDVTNVGTDDKGLLAGYSYAIKAYVGTYTHFTAPVTGSPTPPHVNRPELEDDTNPGFIEM